MAKKVFIGVGHGGKDPGAVANGFKESEFNLDVAKSCADVLKNHGVSVRLSRENDASENLATRIAECKAFKPNLAVDIHFNAGGGDGAEVYHKKKDKTDDTFAKNILTELYAIGQNMHSTTPTKIESGMKTKLTSSGTDYFGFVRQTSCPSVLVECAYIDNKTDVKIVDTLTERKTMGVAIAKGILKTLGVAYKSETVKESKKPATTTNKTSTTSNTSTFKKGDKVKVKKAVTYDGKSFKTYYDVYDVLEVKGDRITIGIGKTVTTAVKGENLTKATSTSTVKTIQVGSTVKVKKGAKTFNGGSLAPFVYERNHKVKEINVDRVVITYNGAVVAAVRKSDLTLID